MLSSQVDDATRRVMRVQTKCYWQPVVTAAAL